MPPLQRAAADLQAIVDLYPRLVDMGTTRTPGQAPGPQAPGPGEPIRLEVLVLERRLRDDLAEACRRFADWLPDGADVAFAPVVDMAAALLDNVIRRCDIAAPGGWPPPVCDQATAASLLEQNLDVDADRLRRICGETERTPLCPVCRQPVDADVAGRRVWCGGCGSRGAPRTGTATQIAAELGCTAARVWQWAHRGLIAPVPSGNPELTVYRVADARRVLESRPARHGRRGRS